MDLQQILNDNSVVLADFFAPWCQPCRMMSPIIDAIATKYSGKLTVIKIDVDQNANLASQYDVQSVPTFIIFKNKEPKERFQGGKPQAQIEELIKPLL